MLKIWIQYQQQWLWYRLCMSSVYIEWKIWVAADKMFNLAQSLPITIQIWFANMHLFLKHSSDALVEWANNAKKTLMWYFLIDSIFFKNFGRLFYKEESYYFFKSLEDNPLSTPLHILNFQCFSSHSIVYMMKSIGN